MKIVFILLVLFTVCILGAQEVGIWSNIRHSSYTIENNIHIRSEIIPLPESSTEFFYSQGEGWLNEELTHVAGETYDAIIPVDPSELIMARYRTVVAQSFDGIDDILPGIEDSITIMMPGYIQEDYFPPLFDDLSLVAEDPAGDIPDNMPSYLDITAEYFSFSDSRIYTAITNDSNEFPTGPFLGPYNLYASLIINPETVFTDSVFYALVYGQIPVIMDSPGLYRFSGFDFDSFQRIGNIEYNISDNTLIKSCSLDLLTSDPYFGDWPNMTNSLIFVTTTIRATLSMEFTFIDMGRIGLMVMEHYLIEPFDNVLPSLTNIDYDYTSDLTTINLTYYDDNGNFPLISEVVIDEEETYQFYPHSFDFNEPLNFSAIFPGNWSNGLIVFSDNGYDLVEVPIFSHSEDILLPDVTRSQITIYPNPFHISVKSQPLTILIDQPTRLSDIKLEIFDIRGRLINSLAGDIIQGDSGSFTWDGLNSEGVPASSGLYFIRYLDKMTQDQAVNRFIIIK